jgi:dephospho-CoA kinase
VFAKGKTPFVTLSHGENNARNSAGNITSKWSIAGEVSVMILGLTGGIASGKSFVADTFVECGAILVSADLLAREVVNPGSPTLVKMVETFGPEILTPGGSLNREVMAQKVFADQAARRQLESITHPAIAHLAECRLAELNLSPHDLIVYEAPLLFEAGGESRVDQVLVVVVDPDLQLARLLQRENLSEAEAKQRISAQWPQADKVQKADFVIDNSGSLQQSRIMVAALYDYLTRTVEHGASSS